MPRLLECVPNFSEGQNPAVLQAIASAVESVEGVKLLHMDQGASAHRTVFTFAGAPAAVVEAAFRAIKTASELIDMRQHKGVHPRMGATDVCPLIPIEGIEMAEVIALSHQLAERVGRELGIPVYLYEHSAQSPLRKNLATIRAGEYEGFKEKIRLPAWQPDYGPKQFNPQAGQTVIGARDFLVAYNINLETDSVKLANAIAFDVREIGRIKKVGGKKQLDAEGKPIRIPGTCKYVKAIGWYIEEFGFAQVSMNLTNIRVSPPHLVFEAVKQSATKRGVKIRGSELIGMIPKRSLLVAGEFYANKKSEKEELPENKLIDLAVQCLGLADLGPFNPHEKIIEYRINQ